MIAIPNNKMTDAKSTLKEVLETRFHRGWSFCLSCQHECHQTNPLQRYVKHNQVIASHQDQSKECHSSDQPDGWWYNPDSCSSMKATVMIAKKRTANFIQYVNIEWFSMPENRSVAPHPVRLKNSSPIPSLMWTPATVSKFPFTIVPAKHGLNLKIEW